MGRRSCILVVEDELLVGLDLEAFFKDNGYEVAGPYRSVAETMRKLPGLPIKGAVLDINLGGEKAFPVADRLSEMGVPFLFLTGYDIAFLPENYRTRPYLEKPYSPDVLLDAVKDMLKCAAGNKPIPSSLARR